MAKARVIRTEASEADLIEIWNHIAADSPNAADRVVRQIGRQIERLTDFPEIGPRRREIAPELRALIVGSYLVLYRYGGDVVEVVRIIHGAHDLTDLL